MPGALLTRPPARKIDWKLAATLRGQGLTFQQIQERTGAVSSEAVRLGLMRRGVNVAVRTALLTRADQTTKQALDGISETTKQDLAEAVQRHVQALAQIKAKPNILKLKRFSEVVEPLVRSAERIHGWNHSGPKSIVNVQMLGSVRLDEIPDTISSVPVQTVTDTEPKPLQ